MLKVKQIFWKLSMYAVPRNLIEEARIKRLYGFNRKNQSRSFQGLSQFNIFFSQFNDFHMILFFYTEAALKLTGRILQNYRNYEKLHMDFSDGTNLLYGDNAQGKTNLLEAIYVCSTTKSHRGSNPSEI